MSIKNVYYEITSFENLLRADKNCASQHTDKWEIIEFRRNLEENLLNLRDRLRRHNLRTINGFFEVDSNQEIDEKILEECMDQYEEMKE